MTRVAVVTGPVGVGKSTVMREADSLLVEAGVQHATVELEDVARFWPAPGAKGDIAYRNLAAIWANYSAAGADRLLLGLLLERRSDLSPVYEAIPGAKITVVRLDAPLSLIEQRLRLREIWVAEAEISAARWWVTRLEGSQVADLVLNNGERRPREVAVEMLQALRWLPT
jgi:hypothetical protein